MTSVTTMNDLNIFFNGFKSVNLNNADLLKQYLDSHNEWCAASKKMIECGNKLFNQTTNMPKLENKNTSGAAAPEIASTSLIGETKPATVLSSTSHFGLFGKRPPATVSSSTSAPAKPQQSSGFGGFGLFSPAKPECGIFGGFGSPPPAKPQQSSGFGGFGAKCT